jgi:hypothetical protein
VKRSRDVALERENRKDELLQRTGLRTARAVEQRTSKRDDLERLGRLRENKSRRDWNALKGP